MFSGTRVPLLRNAVAQKEREVMRYKGNYLLAREIVCYR
jgi:hypothetical protein